MRRLHSIFLSCLLSVPVLAADLAPTGTLRAAFLADNPVQGKLDPATGVVTGPIADLVQELAKRLSVPYKIIPANGARDVMDRVKAHTVDIGFLAYDETRAREVDFSKSYLLMSNNYLVRADSPIKKSADADRAGFKIGAAKGTSQAIYLSEKMKNAQVKIFPENPPSAELERMLTTGELDAFGANGDRMQKAAAKSSKLRVVPDSFFVGEQSIVVPKGADPKLLNELNKFIEDVRKSGLVKRSIQTAKLAGAEAALPGR